MQVDLSLTEAFYKHWPEIKFWGWTFGAISAIYKALDWLKKIKTNDLHHIQLSINSLNTKFDDFATQQKTDNALQHEVLKGIRDDLRAFVTVPLVVAARAKPRKRLTRKR